MLRPFDEIKKLLKENLVKYEEVNHEPVYTSDQAASVRGMDLHAGAKSLLLKADKEFILAVLPGDSRLDTKKLKQILQVKDIRFASPTEVEEIMGCQIGACYPFGSVAKVKMIVDPSLGDNEIISFNPGVHNKSLKIKWEDYKKLYSNDLKIITQ
jgi:Ala-tRNA(Pro) deacylase